MSAEAIPADKDIITTLGARDSVGATLHMIQVRMLRTLTGRVKASTHPSIVRSIWIQSLIQ